jgi:hypothetical protein
MHDALLVTNLPKVVYQEIKKFLVVEISSYEMERLKDTGSYDGYEWEENQRSWRLFLSISRSTYFYSCIRKELYNFRLNWYYSVEYLRKHDFRRLVLHSMASSYHQLSLNLHKVGLEKLDAGDAETLSNCRYVNLSANILTNLPKGLHHIHELNLSFNRRLSDISALHTENNGIHIINLIGTQHIRNVDNLRFVNELSLSETIESVASLGNVTKLCFGINRTNQSQLSFLTNVQYLDLFYKRFKPFGDDGGSDDDDGSGEEDLQTHDMLILKKIPLPQLLSLKTYNMKIKDISNLINLRILKTFEIKKDISHLQPYLQELSYAISEKSIDAIRFPYLTKISFDRDLPKTFRFSNISSFSSIILENSEIIDATIFAKNTKKYLKLSYCDELINVSKLGNIQILDLRDCRQIQSLKGLGKSTQHTVYVSYCLGIRDVSMLQNIQKLSLDFCQNIKNISTLTKIPYLSLRGCKKITDFTNLGKFQKYLNVTGCQYLQNKDLNNFSNIPELIVSYCHLITDVSMLTNVRRLTARHCQGLTVLYLYGDFIKCDFYGCCNVIEVTIYNHIYMLSLSTIPIVHILGSLTVKSDYAVDVDAINTDKEFEIAEDLLIPEREENDECDEDDDEIEDDEEADVGDGSDDDEDRE